ncbi:MAG: DUF3526 domain-containing protein [Myxococcales bacterium]|nr:DUF3526 domain-containing protein [Myxococcales bacterium]
MTGPRSVNAAPRRSLLGTLVRLELRLLLSDRNISFALAFFAIILGLSAWLGGRHAGVHEDAIRAASVAQTAAVESARAQLWELERQRDVPLGARDPRDPGVAGHELAVPLVTLPAGPLASVSAGLRDVRPHAIRVTTGAQLSESLSAAPPLIGPSRQSSGAFDPAFVFVVLFPLVVIALSYDILSGERERGTLALLLSQPLTQRQLVLGKALARATLLIVSGVGTAWLGVLVSGGRLFSDGAWVLTSLYTAGIASYALFWFALAIAVNARGGASSRNALILVGLWLAFTVVVPGLLRVFVESRYPPPSRVELVNEAREAAEEAEAELGSIEGTHGATTTSPKAGDGTLSPMQRAATVQEELAKRTEPVVAAFRQQLEAQQAQVSRLQYASPAVVLQEMLNDVAGTGSQRQDHFERQVDAFQKRWRAFFMQKVDGRVQLTSADWASLPAFSYEDEPLSELLTRTGVGLLGLLLPALLLVLWALPGLRQIGRLST